MHVTFLVPIQISGKCLKLLSLDQKLRDSYLVIDRITVLLLYSVCRFGRSCCLACAFSTPWYKSDESLAHWVGIYRTALTNPT